MCLLGSHGFRFLGSHGSHFFWLTRISRIPRYCFVGGKSHRCFCVWAGSHGSHFFWLTQISQIPRYCFVGGKSHRWFCGWAPVGCFRGAAWGWLSRIYFSDPSDPSDKSDLSDKSDGLGIFKKIIREICGICVRPR